MKKLLAIIGVLIVLLVAVLVVKTWIYPFTKVNTGAAAYENFPISDTTLQRFAGGIRIPTVSDVDYTQFNFGPIQEFAAYLRTAYPNVYAATESYTVNNHGLVIHWKGRNSALQPVLFLSHYDVVPPGEYEGTDSGQIIFSPKDKPQPPVTAIQDKWTHYPFSGAVADGRIYGRGTLDMKNMLFALMESVNNLMAQQYTPERDVYLAFGFDEEVGGVEGALKIAEDFKAKGIRFDAVYDEGGIVSSKGSISGLNATVALIGCAEKGFWSAKVKVKGLGGHSSMPPMQSAIGKAAVIMQRLEKEQMKPMIIPVIDRFFTNVGGAMDFKSRLAIANQWLLKTTLMKTLAASHTTNALIRTTTALTMMKGSDASNVLAPVVDFVVNFRILPGNTVAEVKEHLQYACRGFDVEIEDLRPPREASRISDINSQGYRVMEKTIKQYFPDAIVTPYLTIGGTDGYKYEIVSDHVYRFNPVLINNNEQQTIHNNNEYISIDNYSRMIHYFETLIKNYDGKQ
ncbi:M20/M25/M40 family metallo-hydrolase [Chitinophaga sp. sic0106]|uniref:M20/M25/M40 family metallo-hydrolase n=1 Tax=Chitinophaga sp. sic0106 TaxID=2854785 RepID=UPI001C4966C5|nr:M20/M25/M40 family metallo-hydrolase [Chitinophaga sp. sic0106]MBV7529603.1 M20/M25/M40 family metallo-hydrolase [Chitinophaga sp. sic0106]